jgi:hypothetical protein
MNSLLVQKFSRLFLNSEKKEKEREGVTMRKILIVFILMTCFVGLLTAQETFRRAEVSSEPIGSSQVRSQASPQVTEWAEFDRARDFVGTVFTQPQGGDIRADMIFEESFEGSTFPPTHWMHVDQDGDGRPFWGAGTAADINAGAMGTPPHGNRQAFGRTWLPGMAVGFHADNWLITPPIHLPGPGYLMFWAQNEGPGDGWEPDFLEVLVSVSGTNIGLPIGTMPL